MPAIEPTATTPAIVPHTHEVVSAETPSPLSPPEFVGGTPSDALTEMLLALERQNQSSLELNLSEIKAARERIADLQRQLADELARALEAARRSKKKKKGWFSRTFGRVIDVVAKVVAKQTEAMKDVVVLHADLAVSMVKHFRDREALFQSVKHDLLKLSESSETERAVEGFTTGTLKFMGDVAAFQFVLVAALAENAAEGDAVHRAVRDALTDQAEKLWHSAETNILENPDFWTVTGRLAQGVAVASALASGGTLAPVAVALILALEADDRFGYLEDVFGKEAAPWVRVGMHVAAAASAGSNSNDVLKWMQVALSTLEGTSDIHRGVRTWQEGIRQGDELDRRADMQETLHQIQATQRLMDALIELYEEKSEHRTRTAEASVDLVEARAKVQAALVLQG
ncbi:MAG TPA: hypothetical protein VI197_35445 [Polyangiaceae bacterium]